MVLIVCLSCKKEFSVSSNNARKPTQVKTAVLTSCGHYYHLDCLEAAFMYEKVKMEVEGQPRRKSCPFPLCKRDLAQTSLTKIHPVKFESDEDLESEEDKTVSMLKEEIAYLRKRLQDRRPFELGDKVVYFTKNTGEENHGIVTGINVEIECENPSESTSSSGTRSRPISPTSSSSNNNNSRSGSSWRENLTKKLRHSLSNRETSVTVPIEKVKLADVENSMRSETAEVLRPRWAAGDRIYLPQEKEYAIIKWIGSRQYKFIVAIEYENPVGDDKFDSEDLPFLIQKGHGRRMTIEELNECAEKAELNSPTTILNNLLRWGSKRKKRVRQQSPTFYVDFSDEQPSSQVENNNLKE